MTKVAHAVGALVAPRTDAAAGCSYVWTHCYCSGGVKYGRYCMSGCPGVPNHCQTSYCSAYGTC